MATLLYNTPAALRPRRNFDNLLGEMLRETLLAQPQPAGRFTPATDVVETPAGFELHLALPGVRKEAVKIEFLDGQLRVSGERPNPLAAAQDAAATATEVAAEPRAAHTPVVLPAAEAAPAGQFRRVEGQYGTFERSFRLPDTVNVKAIAADLADGVLRLTLPFDTEKMTRQTIAIR